MLLLAACHRLSANERKVVGTWEQKSFDSTEPEYYVLKPDHSYAFVTAEDVDGKWSHVALATGSWRIEGDDIVMDSTSVDPRPNGEKRPPKKHFNRKRVVEFLRGLKPHAPLSYQMP
jgi:hypothetical protein